MGAPEGYTKLGLVGFVDKGEYSEGATYLKGDVVFYNGSTYKVLKDNLKGVTPSNDKTNYSLMARGFAAKKLAEILAADSSGLVGDAGREVAAQALLDEIADRVATKLIERGKIDNNLLGTDPTHVLASPQGKALDDRITKLNSDLNDRIPVGDLQAIADTNGINSRRIVQCGANTLNTPYKEGLTLGAEGTAYINMSSPDYGTIYYVVSGGNEIYLRSKDNGKWGSWTCIITNTDLDTRIPSNVNFKLTTGGDSKKYIQVFIDNQYYATLEYRAQ